MQIRRTFVKTIAVLCLLFVSYAIANEGVPSRGQSSSNFDYTQVYPALSFEKNVGQTDSRVRFLSRAGRYRVYLTGDAAVLEIAKANSKKRNVVLKTALSGSNTTTRVSGLDIQSAYTNYLIGPREAWKTGVPNYRAVKYEAVYPGIDLVYYGRARQLEYDFDVAPHGNPSSIILNIAGAEKINTSADGSLVLETAAGEVRWAKPFAYQESATGRKLVSASYQVSGNSVSFHVGNYDRNRKLVIDPVLVYGTYLDGAKGFDRYSALLVNSAGYVYVLGSTDSTDFPNTPGAVAQKAPAEGYSHTFVSKLTPDGSALVWSAIIGGSGTYNYAVPNGFTLDQAGNVYVVGGTQDVSYADTTGAPTNYPSTFPTTPGAYNTNHPATSRYFLFKLNNTGSALLYSTFLSDQPNIFPYSVAIDPADNPYITGVYNHNGGLTAAFPATAGVFQSSYGGLDDSFVMKFNTQASALDYATLLGGSQTEDAYQIQVDSNGNATIDGFTYSSNYPITPNGMRQTDEGGFITTLNPAGTGLAFSTVLNHVMSINVKRDAMGDYYAGGAAGTNLPTTSTAYQKTFPATGSGIHLGFLTVINTSGNLVYSSYLAGNPPASDTEDTTIQLISSGTVTVTGDRNSDSTFPVTDRSYEQDNCAFLAKFNIQASGKNSLSYSGCTAVNMTDNLYTEVFRGIPSYSGTAIYLDGNNNLYALSAAGPTTSNAFQKSPPDPNSGDGSHVWVGEYDLSQPSSGVISLSEPYYWGPPYQSPVLYRATSSNQQCSSGMAAMRVYTSPGVIAYTTSGATLNANIAFPKDGIYNTVIVAYDNCGHAFTKGVPMFVQGGTGQDPAVTSPTNGATVSSPVRFAASATAAPSCTKGIAAMRIYTAPGVAAYTVNAASLDTSLTLAPGSYNTVVQAWDNCGSVYKTPVSIVVK